jgi:membrane associated rhomboid family serine protease
MLNEPILTYLLIGLNVAISLYAFTRMNSGAGDKFLFRPYEVSKGREYQGMVLSHFSHADGGHLIFNMLTLYFFGDDVEYGLGIPSMLLIYVAAGILSTLVVYNRHRSDPDYRCLGASDSITGILFAAIVLEPRNSIYFAFIPVPIPAPVFAIAYILLSTYFMQHGRGRLSHEAHLAGAFTGLLLAALLSPNGFGPLFDSIQSLLS